jgi:hypothetical protein
MMMSGNRGLQVTTWTTAMLYEMRRGNWSALVTQLARRIDYFERNLIS